MPDEFEQELLSDISAAEQFGEGELAIEWRLELKSYRAAKQRTVLEGQPWNGSSPGARREALERRRSGRQ